MTNDTQEVLKAMPPMEADLKEFQDWLFCYYEEIKDALQSKPVDEIEYYKLASEELLAENKELTNRMGQAYIVIGALADHTGTFDHPAIQRALDYFSECKYDDDFLPWKVE